MPSQRFCAWLHRYRWALLAGWVVHATILHLAFIGFPSWNAMAYRLPLIANARSGGSPGRCGADRHFGPHRTDPPLARDDVAR